MILPPSVRSPSPTVNCQLLIVNWKQSEQFRIHSVNDLSEVARAVFEVHFVDIDHKEATLVFLEDELVVSAVEVLEIVERHLLLVVASAALDVLYQMRHRCAQINHQFGQSSQLEHLMEQVHVGLEVAVRKVAHRVVIGGEHIDALEDGAVLDDGTSGVADAY